MTTLPGAEPFTFAGGRAGVLLCHGFTGSPAAMRPWGQSLADAGFAVSCPLLPGHGTRWQDMQRTRWQDWYGCVDDALAQLRTDCDAVVVMGLSMGGTLTLRLAEQHGDTLGGIVLVNASVLNRNPLMKALPVLRHVLPFVPGVSNDIKRAGQDEVAYDKVPLQALQSLTELWRLTRDDLPRVSQPMLLMRSLEDHVVEPENAAFILEHATSTDREVVELPDSFHVATLDNDATTIVERSIAFARRVTAGDAAG